MSSTGTRLNESADCDLQSHPIPQLNGGKEPFGTPVEADREVGCANDVWGDDFSTFSSEYCEELRTINSDSKVLASCTDRRAGDSVWSRRPITNQYVDECDGLDREIDLQYVAKLERRLQKLYSKPSQNNRKDMMKQIRDRTDNLFTDNSQLSELEADDLTSNLDYSLLTRRLFPDQLALTEEERLALLKHDVLDSVNGEAQAPQTD